MFTINTAAIAESITEVMPRFLRITPRVGMREVDPLTSTLQDALKHFEQSGGTHGIDFLDLPFVETVAAPVIVDYLQGCYTRHEAAVEIARRRDAGLIEVNSTMRKRRMADAAMAIDHYLTFVRPQAAK